MLTRDKNSSSYINYSTRELFFVTLSYTRARCNYGHRLKACFRSTIITFCRRCGIRIDIKSQSCYHHHHHHFICSVKCKNTLAKTREYWTRRTRLIRALTEAFTWAYVRTVWAMLYSENVGTHTNNNKSSATAEDGRPTLFTSALRRIFSNR